MRRWLLPALAYFALVFSIGFVLGVLRELFLTPRWGRGPAILIELPLMIAASVLAARWVVMRWKLASPQLAWYIGLTAFAMLLVAEYLIALVTSGASPLQFAKEATSPPNLPGLAAQVLFALLPYLVVATRRSQVQ